jgi:membrane peptidoglycan carboxypeptidase
LSSAAFWEARTSTLQARYFSKIAADVDVTVVEGPSARIRFPETGPMDERLGYTALPTVIQALADRGYRIERQAQVSARSAALIDRGIFPLYQEKLQGGLLLRDRLGTPFFAAPNPRQVYETFESIPEVLWHMLLYIESREFLDERYPQRNPAVEWDRLAKSTLELGLRRLGSARNVPGGSTLATQLEKFRHAPEGRTESVRQKIVQMETATLRAYLDGPDTLDAQRRIIRDYLNSVPLAAQHGHGEVLGTADGLFAWYGTPFEEANRLLADRSSSADVSRRAVVIRQALSLLIAHRRPSYYLAHPAGREELTRLTDAYLALLASDGVVAPSLAGEARDAHVTLLSRTPERAPAAFIRQKAANQIRTHLLSRMSVPRLYDLDRFDLTATATLDGRWQAIVADLLERLGNPEEMARLGPAVGSLLDRGDPSKVIYSFTLMETTPLGNVVRVQTDNYDGPLSFAQASRVELGSTAKLRTLVTYLEAIAEIHGRLVPLEPEALRVMPIASQDALTRWVRDSVLARPGDDLHTVLEAAMERRYSASPAERFVTGGGTQTFANFDSTHNRAVPSPAFRPLPARRRPPCRSTR